MRTKVCSPSAEVELLSAAEEVELSELPAAEEPEAALEELGLTTADFAGLVKSPREDGGYDYFLRYNEFIPINTWEIQKLKARVAELEARLGSQTEA